MCLSSGENDSLPVNYQSKSPEDIWTELTGIRCNTDREETGEFTCSSGEQEETACYRQVTDQLIDR